MENDTLNMAWEILTGMWDGNEPLKSAMLIAVAVGTATFMAIAGYYNGKEK